MRRYLGREIGLLILSSIPILISFYILSIDADWARRFVKVQLIGVSLSSWLTLGLAPTLSSLALGSALRPPSWFTLLGAIACPLAAAVTWIADRPDLTDAALVGSVTVLAILYRLPAQRMMGRAVIGAQFFVIGGVPGRLVTTAIVLLCLAHLAYLGAFRGGRERVGILTLGHAYMVSVVKDFFYRGHYLLLSSFGLAGEHYASILRLLDIASRPTDYLFQRLVDEAQIASRLQHVAALVPFSAAAIALVMLVLPSFGWAPWDVVTFTAISAALIVVTKYLAYEQNSMLRFFSMTSFYVSAIIVAFPLAFLLGHNQLPLPYFVGSLSILTLGLLIFRMRLARGASSPSAMGRPE